MASSSKSLPFLLSFRLFSSELRFSSPRISSAPRVKRQFKPPTPQNAFLHHSRFRSHPLFLQSFQYSLSTNIHKAAINMAAPAVMPMVPIEIPSLPSGTVKDFIPYLASHPDTPLQDLLPPFKAFEGELRKVFAQQPSHEAVKDGTVNLVPIFAGHEQDVKIRARSFDTESEEETARYIMPLKDDERKPDGSPAVVGSFKEFQQNFNLFSESSLVDIDWSNVVAAGSAVTTALLPVPEKWATTKRSTREYYHEHLAPASDVDLFLYGLNEEEGLEKIKQIEQGIRDSILHETTTIRTKNAITIASQYPTRHIQIVLRLYDSISQIITGFDVDCACAAYDGKQVYAAPRALAAFMTQCNTVDVTRRSPSYENRLSKYSHRGFEVYWPMLDRTKIDPTIFERSFGRTQGLARLLVLEKLPKTADRDRYMDRRRAERGRPAINRGYRDQYRLGGNIKDQQEDEVAEWVDQEEVSSYHTMVVPYGPKYNAAKINRLLYAKDLLLNAEWNQQKEREVYLHRHPCFFGTAAEVLSDCCGACPVPKTDEELEVAEQEERLFISGPLKFLVDDPGRQEIGSFNPITDDEWTTMAYIGDTARLCQAIVDGDLEHVQDWCSQEGVDVNRRDFTGRTPLHLATMASTPEIVQCLINHGARLINRLVDGRTALHLAAARGSAEMVKALMNKSQANEEEEAQKEESRKAARKAERAAASKSEEEKKGDDEDESMTEAGLEEDDPEDFDMDKSSEASSREGSDSMTMGSFVKVEKEKPSQEVDVLEDSSEEPDIYEIDVIAWDYGLSPLHLAILNGHLDIIKLLVSDYGADVLLPVKIFSPGSTNAEGTIMSMLLALYLPTEKAKAVVKLLLELGATSAQADMSRHTVFHHVVAEGDNDILDILLENDRPVALSVLNNIGAYGQGQGETPLSTAIELKNEAMVSKLLALGSKPQRPFDDWVVAYLEANPYAKSLGHEQSMRQFKTNFTQPIIAAAGKEMGVTVQELLKYGADPLALERQAHTFLEPSFNGYYNRNIPESLLDIVQVKLKALREWRPHTPCSYNRNTRCGCGEYHYGSPPLKPEVLRNRDYYISSYTEGSYQYWTALRDFESKKISTQEARERYEKSLEKDSTKEDQKGLDAKQAAINKAIKEFENAEKALIEAGAKKFVEMYPDAPKATTPTPAGYTAPEPLPYETKLSFHVADLNDAKKAGYVRLFEAAWNNDLATIKALTLAPWSPDADEATVNPLRIAVIDLAGFSPFSIAVLRGHFELAKKIVEICMTQYHKDDGKTLNQRWMMKGVNRYDDSDEESEDEGDEHDQLPIYSELVGDQFTLNILGEVSTLVKSDVNPMDMIGWIGQTGRFSTKHQTRQSLDTRKSLLQHAVETDDMSLFKFIFELRAEQHSQLVEEDDDQNRWSVERSIFLSAIQLGRTAMLGEMIKASGVGIPLNELVKESGVEIKTKSRYYQGLNVGGKKREDWAAPPDASAKPFQEKIPPLLQAAHYGSIDSVEWFMSDAPMRRYREFAEANKHDKRVENLYASEMGFERTITKWLNYKCETLLHCAILSDIPDKANPPPSYLALIKHILSASPDSLEAKSSYGFTPLHVAICARRNTAASYLISIGANQRNRDVFGRNMIHNMLVGHEKTIGVYPSEIARCDDKTALLGETISLFDNDAVKEMLLERCSNDPGALTPLAYWMALASGSYPKPSVVKILTSHSTGEELTMINGEGDLPLHVAIKQGLSAITEYLISLNTSLLYRENATGRTPLEMSRDIYLASCVSTPKKIPTVNLWNNNYNPGREPLSIMVNEAPSTFLEAKKEDGKKKDNKKRTWEICVGIDEGIEREGGERKRRLVSLFEANEVAKRIGGGGRGQGVVNGGLVGVVKTDVVNEWMD